MVDLSGKTVVVSGASSGIGKACAKEAAKLGAKLILLGRDEKRLQDLLSQLGEKEHHSIAHDITDYKGLQEKLEAFLEASNSKVNGFVHAAGIYYIMPFALTKTQVFRDMYEVNVLAGLELIKVLSKKKYMPDNGVSYLFISSVMGIVGNHGLSSYCASKSAISSLIKSLALEYANKKVRVNAINPGSVETPMLQRSFEKMTATEVESIIAAHPLGLGKPEDISALACFLLSDRSRWISGSNIVIDGGYSAR